MDAYINDSLAVGIIQPSFPPIGAGFFLVAINDGFTTPLHRLLGIEQYHCLEQIPSAPINSAFKPLQWATIFTTQNTI